MFKRTLDESQRFIRPAAEAVGPLHPVRTLIDHYSVDDLLRAVDAGLAVYEAGDLLLACLSDVRILRELNAPERPAPQAENVRVREEQRARRRAEIGGTGKAA